MELGWGWSVKRSIGSISFLLSVNRFCKRMVMDGWMDE